MALFGYKQPAQCDICGGETGTAENKKHKAKDGVVCDDCFLKVGFPKYGACFGFSIEMLKEQLSNDDGVSIFDRYKGVAGPVSNESSAGIPKEKNVGQIQCPRCSSTQISADKKGFGVGKAVIGAAVAGPAGLVAGNMGSKKVRITCLKCGHHWMAGKG